jgi:hypothetical protein
VTMIHRLTPGLAPAVDSPERTVDHPYRLANQVQAPASDRHGRRVVDTVTRDEPRR